MIVQACVGIGHEENLTIIGRKGDVGFIDLVLSDLLVRAVGQVHHIDLAIQDIIVQWRRCPRVNKMGPVSGECERTHGEFPIGYPLLFLGVYIDYPQMAMPPVLLEKVGVVLNLILFLFFLGLGIGGNEVNFLSVSRPLKRTHATFMLGELNGLAASVVQKVKACSL